MQYCAAIDYDELAMHATAFQYVPKETIIKEGAYGEYCYIVIKGIVNSYNSTDNGSGSGKVSCRYQEGDFIGKQFLTTCTNTNTNTNKTIKYMLYHETLQAMSNTSVCAIPIPYLLAHVGVQCDTKKGHYLRDLTKLFLQYIINTKTNSLENNNKNNKKSVLSLSELNRELNSEGISEYRKTTLKKERIQYMLDTCLTPPKIRDKLGELFEPLYTPQPPVEAFKINKIKSNNNNDFESNISESNTTTNTTNNTNLEHSYIHRSSVVHNYNQTKLDELVTGCAIGEGDINKPEFCNNQNNKEKSLKILSDRLGIPWETILNYCKCSVHSVCCVTVCIYIGS